MFFFLFTDVDRTPTKSNVDKDVDRLEDDMIELDLTAETNVINKEDIIQKTQDSASYLLNILEEEKKTPTHKSSKVSLPKVLLQFIFKCFASVYQQYCPSNS